MTNPTRGAEQVAIEVLDTCVKGTSPGGQELNVCVELPKATVLIQAAIDEAVGDALSYIDILIKNCKSKAKRSIYRHARDAAACALANTPKEEK